MIGVLTVSFSFADTLTLRSGRMVSGQYLGGDARHIRMAVGDHVDTFDVGDVGDLQFGDVLPPTPPPQPPPPPTYRDRDQDRGRDQGFAQQPPASSVPVAGVQIPAGTPITVRMIDKVDSEQTRLGQTFRASVDEPIEVNGQTVIPRGADADVKLVEDKQSGKFEGRTVLTLVLQRVTVNGRMVDISTGDVSKESGSRGSRTAKSSGRHYGAGSDCRRARGRGQGGRDWRSFGRSGRRDCRSGDQRPSGQDPGRDALDVLPSTADPVLVDYSNRSYKPNRTFHFLRHRGPRGGNPTEQRGELC